MGNNMTKTEIINSILEGDNLIDLEDEEIMHILVGKTLARDTSSAQKGKITFGEIMADRLARFAGSWVFILTFLFILILWIIFNSVSKTHNFDPFPFILLNLVLSCVAAMQAPVIMMSQNRQEEKDRIRARNDYEVNLKSELIIEDLHYKLDDVISNQEIILGKISKLEAKRL